MCFLATADPSVTPLEIGNGLLSPPSVPFDRGFTLSCGRLLDGRFQSTFSLQGGSIGVRGFFGSPKWLVPADGFEFRTHGGDLTDLVEHGLEILREKGVLRVHVLTDLTRPNEVNFWQRLGWQPCPGEKLFHLNDPMQSLSEAHLPKGYSLARASVADIAYLESLVSSVPELAFQNWEFALIGNDLQNSDRYYRVIRYAEKPVAVAIAGRIGATATFSHVWVREEDRHHGLGGHLVSSVVNDMASHGVDHIYLMTTPGNEGANKFWRRRGFREVEGRGFLELDV